MYSPQITPFQPSNIDATTKMLMGLQQKGQLQQYVAQHKNDPNLVSLALYVSNMSKARPAVQAEANQPKVVDQAIAGMAQALPEDQGIATLPAQNMQNFAGGGIVAFDEGGEVPRFYEGAFMMPPKIPEGAIVMGNMYKDPDTGEMKYIPGSEPQRSGYEGMTLSDLGGAAKRGLEKLLLNPKEQRRAEIKSKNAEAEQRLGPLMKGYVPMRSDDQQFESEVAKRNNAVDPAATAINTPGAGTTSAPPVPMGGARQASPSAAAPVRTAPAGLTALNTKPMSAEEAMAAAGKFGDDKAMRAELQGYVDRQKRIGEEAVGSFEKGIAGLPEAYKKYEARLQKEEAEAATDKDKAIGMSIFKAGLAMMSGTSQNAFENIGKGAMVGLEDQQAALKDFKKAQRERDKAFGDIEAARLADQRGDLKTKLELENRAADRNANAEGKMVEGIATLFSTNKTNARGIYQTGIEQANQNQRSMFEQGAATDRTLIQERGANARTQAQLNAPPAEARMAMMLGTGKTDSERLESGLRKVQDLQSDKTGATYAKLYADHVTEARKQMTEPMTPTEFAASMRGILAAMSPKVTTMPGANAPVYDRPK